MATFKVDINAGKKVIDAEENSRLIDVLALQNIFLPSACGSSGKCGLCKVTIKKGRCIYTDSENMLLSDNEKKTNVSLACQVVVSDNLEIELPHEYLGAKEFTAEVSSKKVLTKDIVELTLILKSPVSIHFNAGQYITLKMPSSGDRMGAMRPFSIASSNAEHSFIQLNIRLNPQGVVTPWIFNELQVGQEVAFSGPRGNFFMRNTTKPMLFIAGGSGMAPVRSILKTMKNHHNSRHAIYFFGALTKDDLYYVDEMAELQDSLPDFRFVPALSNEPTGSDWSGERGNVIEAMDRICTDKLSDYEAYLCGKPAMIEGCVAALEKKGLDKNQVFFDLFNSPKPVMSGK